MGDFPGTVWETGTSLATYKPFGLENENYPFKALGHTKYVHQRLQDVRSTCTKWGVSYPELTADFIFDGRDHYGVPPVVFGTGGICPFDHPVTVGITMADAIAAWESLVNTQADIYGNFGTDVICSMFKSNANGFRCIDKPKPPATKELAIERYASEYTAATICDPLKQNSPFQCTPTDTPPTTKELAIERYTAAYTSESICAPLKLNSPFQCTRNVEVPTTTILSLSVASAQAVFAAGGLVFVSLLRKLEKPGKNTATSVDDDLRVLVRKLRVGQDELRDGQEKLRVGQDELRVGQDEVRGGQSRHEELIESLLKKGGDHQV
jgi:hypothetical protein